MTSTGSGQLSSNAMSLVYTSISIASVVLIVVSVVVSNRNNRTPNYSPHPTSVPSPVASQVPIPVASQVPIPSDPCKLRWLARPVVRPSRRSPPPQTKPSPTGCVDKPYYDPDSAVLFTRPPKANSIRPPSPRYPIQHPIPMSRPFSMSMRDELSNLVVPHEIDDPTVSTSMQDGEVGHGFNWKGEIINPSPSDGDGGVSTKSTRTTNDTISSHWNEYFDDVGFD